MHVMRKNTKQNPTFLIIFTNLHKSLYINNISYNEKLVKRAHVNNSIVRYASNFKVSSSTINTEY